MNIKIFCFVLLFSSCATRAPIGAQKSLSENKSIILDHKYFKIAYNPKTRLADYVVYQLTAEHLKMGEGKRKDKFIVDPLLVEKNLPYVKPAEYAKSGYDKGHLAPSADFAWSQEANDMTFVMSNMAPQSPDLNRNAWRRLEDQVRKWACGEKMVTVVTGPIHQENLAPLKSGLEVPGAFFKIVIDETPPTKMISFIYYQSDKGDMLAKRMVPLKMVETSTGIAFNQEVVPQMKNENLRMPANLNEWKEADCN